MCEKLWWWWFFAVVLIEPQQWFLYCYCLSLLRSSSNADATASFEGVLFPLFQKILGEDVSEFAPYVFQLLAQVKKPGAVGC